MQVQQAKKKESEYLGEIIGVYQTSSLNYTLITLTRYTLTRYTLTLTYKVYKSAIISETQRTPFSSLQKNI